VQTERVIPATIERLGGDPAKVAHAGQGHIHQPVKKFVHAVTAESDHGPDRHAFAHFERRDGLLGARDHRLLTGDLRQLVRRRIENLRVLRCFADAHVDDDLVELGNRMGFLSSNSFISAGATSLEKRLSRRVPSFRLARGRPWGAASTFSASFPLPFCCCSLFAISRYRLSYLSRVLPPFLQTRTLRSLRSS